VACFPARAVAGCSICCLPKETTINFHIRMMPIGIAVGNGVVTRSC
jgi:hypothetical protein